MIGSNAVVAAKPRSDPSSNNYFVADYYLGDYSSNSVVESTAQQLNNVQAVSDGVNLLIFFNRPVNPSPPSGGAARSLNIASGDNSIIWASGEIRSGTSGSNLNEHNQRYEGQLNLITGEASVIKTTDTFLQVYAILVAIAWLVLCL